jgi:hypothetical protein
MQRVWKLPGAYATWTITLTTAPSPGATETFQDEWPANQVERIGDYFSDVVNLLESQRLVEEHLAPRGTIVR